MVYMKNLFEYCTVILSMFPNCKKVKIPLPNIHLDSFPFLFLWSGIQAQQRFLAESSTVLEIWLWRLPLQKECCSFAFLTYKWGVCLQADHTGTKNPPLNQFMLFHRCTPLQNTGEDWPTSMPWVHSDIPNENFSRIVYIWWNQVSAIGSSYFWASQC